MNKNWIIFLLLPALLIGCNNSESKTVAADSATDGKMTENPYVANLQTLSSKNTMTEVLTQGWELEEDLESLVASNDPMGMQPFRSFYFSADGTVVKNPRSNIEFGKWKFDQGGKVISMTYTDGSKDAYKIASLSPKELIVINSGVGSLSKMKFVAAGKQYKEVTNNPYHESNNQWRIAPKKSEDDAAVRSRLKAFIHFHLLFYKDNIARQEKLISFYGFPTCIKWYAGGIFMLKKDKLPENWIDCFYNKEQALKAYDMMEAVATKKYIWPKDKMSWVKKNLIVLEMMNEKL